MILSCLCSDRPQATCNNHVDTPALRVANKFTFPQRVSRVDAWMPCSGSLLVLFMLFTPYIHILDYCLIKIFWSYLILLHLMLSFISGRPRTEPDCLWKRRHQHDRIPAGRLQKPNPQTLLWWLGPTRLRGLAGGGSRPHFGEWLWRYSTISALFVLMVTSGSPHKPVVNQSFKAFLVVSLNKLSNKQPICLWFETALRWCDNFTDFAN